jgi:hypothetical protein
MDERVAGKRWNEKEAQRAVAGWRRSGLSASEYGRAHGVQGQRLSWWSKRLAVGSTSDSSVRLVPAEVISETYVRARAAVVVRLGAEVAVEITDTAAVGASWVAALVRELASAT